MSLFPFHIRRKSATKRTKKKQTAEAINNKKRCMQCASRIENKKKRRKFTNERIKNTNEWNKEYTWSEWRIQLKEKRSTKEKNKTCQWSVWRFSSLISCASSPLLTFAVGWLVHLCLNEGETLLESNWTFFLSVSSIS